MAPPLRKMKSCGVLLFRTEPRLQFLLMRHANRLDLPKGHMEEGEDEYSTAMRELREETGYGVDDVTLQKGFRHEVIYHAPYRRFGGDMVEKTLVVFLGRLLVAREPKLTEHMGFQWVVWNPPHRLQPNTVDGLLMHVEDFLRDGGAV